MKNQFTLIIFGLVAPFFLIAQEAERDVKKADKLLGFYYLDTKANLPKVYEAKSLIDGVIDNPSVSGMYKTWITKGKIYNVVAAIENDSLVIMQQLGKSYAIKDLTTAIQAYNALLKAKELAVKSFEIKDALDALEETAQYLNNFGYFAYQVQNYKAAFENFQANVGINKVSIENGRKSIFPKDEDLLNQQYITALSAMNAKMDTDAKVYLELLKEKNYDDGKGAGAVIYEGLFNFYIKTEEQKALDILAEGRQKFPDNSTLLFAEINYFLKQGKLNELIDKLKIAIAKEPDNVSVYTTLGNVYDNLCQKEWEAGNAAKGEEFYTQGLNYYNQAIAKDPNNFTAIYSVGALYYNKAAQVSKEANKLSNDYTKEGTRKYNEKKAEMESYFDKALPFFEKSETLEPKDRNTLIALKEIYARKNQLEKSKAYKSKLEALGN
ncbi:MAG: hypothetical protein M3Q56_07260 [Bacteroidota bacterium]|nr:hypothetical protein [Bacteroidota bacterium]